MVKFEEPLQLQDSVRNSEVGGSSKQTVPIPGGSRNVSKTGFRGESGLKLNERKIQVSKPELRGLGKWPHSTKEADSGP